MPIDYVIMANIEMSQLPTHWTVIRWLIPIDIWLIDQSVTVTVMWQFHFSFTHTHIIMFLIARTQKEKKKRYYSYRNKRGERTYIVLRRILSLYFHKHHFFFYISSIGGVTAIHGNILHDYVKNIKWLS